MWIMHISASSSTERREVKLLDLELDVENGSVLHGLDLYDALYLVIMIDSSL